MKKQVYKQSRWNLKDLLKEHKGKDFDNFIKSIDSNVEKFESYRKELNPNISVEKVLEIIKFMEKIEVDITKVSAYSYMWFSMDTKSQESRAFKDKMTNHFAELGNKMLFFSLWFKSLDDQNAKRLVNGAGDYKYLLERITLTKKYALSEPEEKVINIKDTTGVNTLGSLYDITVAGFRYDIIVKGKKKTINQSELTSYVRDTNPKIREHAYNVLFKKYNDNKDVLGEIYKGIVTDWKNECLKLRGYKSYISPRNIGNDISDKAIETMLNTVKRNISLFHRYFKLKAKLLNMKKMSRYHLYAPVSSKSENFNYNDGVNIVLECYNSFSPDMAKLALQIINKQHVDSVISDSKMGGAYCMDIAPGVTPYVLINYTGKDRDVSTLAHELGHGVHDLLAHNNPPILSHAPLILAETASVFGEMIVTEKLISEEKNKKAKQALIASKLDDIYATIIRQSYFTIFEQEAHKAIDNGATVDDLSNIWLGTLKEQFGSAVDVPDDFKIEWTYIPHIYHTPFYCYAYSFGNLLVLALYQMYKNEGKSFVPKYLKFLSYGGSKKPAEIAAELGIDFESEKFWQQGFDAIKEMIDELESFMKK